MAHRSEREIAQDPWGDLGGGLRFADWLGVFDDFQNWIIALLTPYEWEYERDRRDQSGTQIPVGLPDVQPLPEIAGDELSDLVIAESPGRTPPIFSEVSMPDPNDPRWGTVTYGKREDTIAGAGGIAADWYDYWDKVERGVFVLPPTPPTIVERAEDILLTPVEDVEMEEVVSFFDDLGDIFIDVARQRFGPDFEPTPAPRVNGGNGLPPAYDPAPGAVAATCDTGPSPVYKKVCGVYKWVYPKRRRRRQLLTESDYNGLLRIESLKVNKNMTVAIAKALTR